MNMMHEAAAEILNDEKMLEHIAYQCFALMDVDKDGSLDKSEVLSFIGGICQENGLSTGLNWEKPPKY